MTLRIAGSMWSVPRSQLRAEADRLAAAGLEVWHWDRADGSLGTAGGFSAHLARDITEATGLRSEAHLMLDDPRPEIAEWAAFSELVIVHAESMHWRECIRIIDASGARAGLAISPGSPVPTDLPDDVAVLIMTVAPGNAGTGFLEDQVALLDGVTAHWLRGVDGSVSLERGARARSHGANWLVSGTALMNASDPRDWLATAAGTRADDTPLI